MFALGLGLGI